MSKFLKLFFGCHARPDRSFFWKGKQFPICARCTGELCGMIFSIPIIIFLGYMPLKWCFLMMIPLIVDGTIQLKTSWESNNILRLITGIIFGIAIGFLFVHIHIFTVKLAIYFLRTFFGDSPYFNELVLKLTSKQLIK